jgi:UDP-4-amino-4,6-dideoxy-N-acetyl-beta-L-altrosamine transaminase
MAARFLPYSRQTIEEDDLAAVARSLIGDFLTTGPTVAIFEAAITAETTTKHAVVCANGTAALHLAAIAIGLEPGDQAIVPSITFVATANAARYRGADVVFADVDPDTGLLTPATFDEALRRAPRAKAVFPVHLGGQSVEMEPIYQAARARGMKVVEDACHALGGRYRDGQGISGPVGDCRFSDAAIFSFHPVKAIATGEGGAIVTNDDALQKKLADARSHGIVRSASEFRRPELAIDAIGAPNPWYYELHELGFNYRLPDILCALGISQLRKLSRFLAERRRLAALYDEALAHLAPRLRPVPRRPWSESGLHLYPVLIDFAEARLDRAGLMNALRAEGIGTQVHYIPVHLQPYYQKLAPGLELTGARRYYERTLSLPLYPKLTSGDVARVVDALGRLL